MKKEKDVCLAYADSLIALGEKNDAVFVLDADVSLASKTSLFGKKFPDRFLNVGVAEQNMVSIAAGLATIGYRPFVTSLARFVSTRCLDQIISCLAHPKLNVNIVGFYAGLSIGKDGASHQALEDIGIFRSIPNMGIVCPGSLREIKDLVTQAFDINQPIYFRLSEGLNRFGYPDQETTFGKGVKLSEGNALTVITTGLMTGIAYQALSQLENFKNIEIIHLHTLKPVDKNLILKSALKTKNVLTIEEHNVVGGLGSIVADVLTESKGVVLKKMGIQDQFGMSGSHDELLDRFELSPPHIVSSVNNLIQLTN